MIFTHLSLPGAFEIAIEPIADARGSFARTFCSAEFARHGLNTDWAQMNMSVSTQAGTLRGLHFQRPPHGEIKLVRAVRGRALDVIVDCRKRSATFGGHVAVMLDESRRNAVYIPEGFAHGFQTLTDDCELHYIHSVAYEPASEGGINALDPALGIAWPLPVTARSDRDKALTLLKETEPL